MASRRNSTKSKLKLRPSTSNSNLTHTLAATFSCFTSPSPSLSRVTSPNRNLNKIRNRTAFKASVRIKPRTFAEDTELLPCRLKKRPQQQNTQTVLEELALSDHLMFEDGMKQTEYDSVSKQHADALQGIKPSDPKHSELISQNIQLKTELQFARHQFVVIEGNDAEFLRSKCNTYKDLLRQKTVNLEAANAKIEQLTQSLNKSADREGILSQEVNLLRIQLITAVERLSPLYKSFKDLIGANSLQIKLKAEFETVKTNWKADEFIQTTQVAETLKKQVSELTTQLFTTFRLTGDAIKSRNSALIEVNDKLTATEKALGDMVKECNALKQLNADLEVKLTQQRKHTDQLATLAKSWKAMSESQDPKEVKCKVCGGFYTVSKNFEGDCRTHKNIYKGRKWMCCGASSETAVGCVVGIHRQALEVRPTEVTLQGSSWCSVICT